MLWLTVHPRLLFLVLLFGLMLMVEAGLRLRGLWGNSDEERQSLVDSARDGLSVLLSLLLGFSLPMAQPHYDQRNQLIIDEANEIETVRERAEMLPEPFRGKIVELLREYVDTRIDYNNEGLNEAAIRKLATRAKELQHAMWQQSVMLVQKNPTITTPLFTQSLGLLSDLVEKRLAADEKRIPSAIWLVLTLISMLTAFVVGYSMRRRFLLTMLVLPLTVAIVLSLVAELDSPRTGAIRLEQRSLERLQLDMR